MEDRYLYKAKRKDNREWVIGFYAYINKKHYIYTGQLIHSGLYDIAERFEIDPPTICQCTGLKDDNGTPIFENDMLSLTDKVNDYEWKAVVKFGNPNAEYAWGWWLIPLTKCDANKDILLWIETELNTIECRVIGNIFDNPELLESEE